MKKILHLVLKHKWYDMITNGEKDEEYRLNKEHYWKLIYECSNGHKILKCPDAGNSCPQCSRMIPKRFTHVCFHKGYTNETVQYPIDSITIGYGRSEWGAPEDEKVIIIKFDKTIYY